MQLDRSVIFLRRVFLVHKVQKVTVVSMVHLVALVNVSAVFFFHFLT